MKDPALNPVHPGEILAEDFLKPMGMKTIRPARPLAQAA
jgi:plasmid maintenance system antidote protein VapI